MKIQRIAAFSDQGQGGNPAGVVIGDALPDEAQMLKVAKQVGYSETAFLMPHKDGWRIRYFAPEMEVPFCGHATIASGAALGDAIGTGHYKLYLNDGEISVNVSASATGVIRVSLQSPETHSELAPQAVVDSVLAEFSWCLSDIDADYPVRLASAGAQHLILVLKEQQTLSSMAYDFDRLKALMQQHDLVTINLLWPESQQRFHCRNPFAAGGVYEDPATGAAAAAFAGYLRDINWPGNKQFEILQGQHMGVPSRLTVEFGPDKGESIQVSGETRQIQPSEV